MIDIKGDGGILYTLVESKNIESKNVETKMSKKVE
jgi:hypothetical protein